MNEGFVQRFDTVVLTPFLPTKHEYVVLVKLSELQVTLYTHFLKNHANRCKNHIRQGSSIFSDFNQLVLLWTHPKAFLKTQNFDVAKKNRDSDGSASIFIADRGEIPSENKIEESGT